MSKSQFLFVIDTDSYSGNFERKMCAYMTGQIGDCGVGGEMADIALQEVANGDEGYWEDQSNLIGDLVESCMDEDDGCRPATIWATLNRYNDGMGGHYGDSDDRNMVVARYRNEWSKRYEQTKDPEDREKSKTAEPGRYPAYESVAIYMRRRPSNEEIEILKNRAMAFPEAHLSHECSQSSWVTRKNTPLIQIKGFRLVEIKSKVKTEVIAL